MKVISFNRLCILAFALSLAYCNIDLQATTQQHIRSYYAKDLKPIDSTRALDSIRMQTRLESVIDSLRVRREGRPDVASCTTTLVLSLNNELAVVPSHSFSVRIEGVLESVLAYGMTSPPRRDSFHLTLDYDPNSTTYRARDAMSFQHLVHSNIQCVVRYNGVALSSIVPDSLFRFDIVTEAEVYYKPDPSQVPTMHSILVDSAARYLQLSWSYLPWAEYYEVEYVYVDDYSSTTAAKEVSTLRYNCRRDAIRLRSTLNSLEIPLVFEQGYIVARVRAVGMKGESFSIPVLGQWSLPDEGTIALGPGVFHVSNSYVHEADRLNWVHVSGFDESGNRTDLLSYSDATHRTRQRVEASPADNRVRISESFYDHQGRPTISTLAAPARPLGSGLTPEPRLQIGSPTGFSPGSLRLRSEDVATQPVRNFPYISGSVQQRIRTWNGSGVPHVGSRGGASAFGINPHAVDELADPINRYDVPEFIDLFSYRSTKARLGFVPDFNVSTEGRSPTRDLYDRADSLCSASAFRFGTQSGAGNYFSSDNPEQARWQAFVPSAQGYPYVQMKYASDGSGQVSESSMPGLSHAFGSGHTERFYFGTPAQAELDRFFGSAAGIASFYRKTLMIDENGQGHVTITDLKGNMVLSGLSGGSASNLVALSGVEQRLVSVDLIEENSVLNSAEQSWETSKQIVVSNNNTRLQLEYRVNTPQLPGTQCNGRAICLDCVYDLDIRLTDQCGNELFHHLSTIGNLVELMRCNPVSIRINDSLLLARGSYLLTKKLRVNAAAIDRRIEQYRAEYTCRDTSVLTLPDIDASCNPPCNTCILLNSSAVRIRRRDGSNPSIAFSKRKAGNRIGCARDCIDAGLGELSLAFQSMLSEVSPGGQYGRYLDTMMRDEASPLGMVHPDIHALSVFNTDNQLPLLNAHWRNPMFEYQTSSGDTAWIEIDADDKPEHRSPSAEIRNIDGKRFVLPKYLNHLDDFIAAWQSQWAESMVAYHPEYEHYLWSLENRNSFSFDSLMLAHDTLAAARAVGAADITRDPFFASSSARRAELDAKLNRWFVDGSTVISAQQMAVAMVNCANPNFNAAEFRECYNTKSLYGTPGSENKEWVAFRGFYRSAKLAILNNERNASIVRRGGFDNRSIGGSSDVAADPLYAGQKRVFKTAEDAFIETDAVDLTGPAPSAELLARILAFSQAKQRERFADCGVCPLAIDINTFLNALVVEKKLTQDHLVVAGTTPLVFSKNIVNSLSRPSALRYDWVLRSDPRTNVLDYAIMVGTEQVGDLRLTKSKSNLRWEDVIFFDCLTTTAERSFTLRAIDKHDSIDVVQCQSSRFNVRGCTFEASCASLPSRDEMLRFLQFVFDRSRYQQRDLIVHRNGEVSPHFGHSLRAQHPGARIWEWDFSAFESAAKKSFTANLKVSIGSELVKARIVQCPFTLSILDPRMSFDSLGFPFAIRRASTSPGTTDVTTAIVSFRSRGGIVFDAQLRSCYPLFDCQPPGTQHKQRPTVCCLPAPRHIPAVNNCEVDLRAIALRERERDFLWRRERAADSLRSALMTHCLMNVQETFRVVYPDDIYLATLRYFNHAAELVKTVPPLGVHPLTDSEVLRCADYRRRSIDSTVYPVHTLVTEYRHTSYGNVCTKQSPDEGLTTWSFDKAGREQLKQNAEQRSRSRVSYKLYDAFNREREIGSSDQPGDWSAFVSSDFVASSVRNKTEIRNTSYDEADYSFVGGFAQANLRNRRSIVRYSALGRATDYIAGYSYDVFGNLKEFVQSYLVLGLAEDQLTKRIRYDFDELSGQMLSIQYQPGKSDQLLYSFHYDENKRLKVVKSSTSNLISESLYDTEARYDYYLHGPLARMELGNDHIQGVDYAYTIHGWLKGINSYSAEKERDMGKDGNRVGEWRYGLFSEDAFGELVNYFEGDYSPIGSSATSFFPERLGVLQSDFSRSLYCGTIQSTITTSAQTAVGTQSTLAQAYSYDQAKRLRVAKSMSTSGGVLDGAFSNAYAMTLDYDLNANIQRLTRSGADGALFDDVQYHYNSANGVNRLDYVSDAVAGYTTSQAELRNQSANNYGYDPIGRMTSMRTEGLGRIRYNDASRVVKVEKETSADSVVYYYDAFGKRFAKSYRGQVEWSVNGPDGNSVALYTIRDRSIRWTESPIYAGKRIGVFAPNISDSARELRNDVVFRGKKCYELSNHIGDVLAVVSDKKSALRGSSVSRAEVRSTRNYFPFGYPMPQTLQGDSSYRYGFQGMESDDAFLSPETEYTTELRQYDPRLCRWMSTDPMAGSLAGVSPYQAYDNNPLLLKDPRGAQSADPEHDPAAQIAALGDVFNFPGYLMDRASEAVGNFVDRARQDFHSAVTGDYTDRGRAAVLEIHPVTDAAVYWYETASGETVTPDEATELDRNIGNGVVTTLIEMNLREADPNLSEEAVRGLASTASELIPVSFGTNELVDAAVDIPVEGFQETVVSVAVPRRVRQEVRRSLDQIDRQLNPGEQEPTPRQRRREAREEQERQAREARQALQALETDLNRQATTQPRGERRRRTEQRQETERRPRRERARQSGAGQRPNSTGRR